MSATGCGLNGSTQHPGEKRDREQATKLEKYLIELGDTHARMDRMDDLIAFLMNSEGAIEIVLQLIEEARAYRDVLQGQLAGGEASDQLERLKIELGDELLMPALAESPEPPDYPWRR